MLGLCCCMDAFFWIRCNGLVYKRDLSKSRTAHVPKGRCISNHWAKEVFQLILIYHLLGEPLANASCVSTFCHFSVLISLTSKPREVILIAPSSTRHCLHLTFRFSPLSIHFLTTAFCRILRLNTSRARWTQALSTLLLVHLHPIGNDGQTRGSTHHLHAEDAWIYFPSTWDWL